MNADRIRGFYAVVDGPGPLAAALVRAGAAVVQLRMKSASAAELLESARLLRRALPETPLIINDRIDVALASGADGVHLGQDDLPLAAAVRLRAARPLAIGISTHDLDQVRAAAAGGASYLGYGPVFATATKDNPDPIQGTAALSRAVTAAGRVPVVAIGGITVAAAAAVAATGVAAICAIAAVNAAAEPAAAVRAFSAALAAARAR
jgi:thiamine-phosphate pyrophosphorylase